MTTPVRGSEGTTRMQAVDGNVSTSASALTTGATPLPQPAYAGSPPTDDLQTALAVLMVQTARDQRAIADKQRDAGAKAQEEAHAKKIAAMKELADDTFSQALVDGVFAGVGAAAQAGAACASFSGTMKEISAKNETCPVAAKDMAIRAAIDTRASKWLEAGGNATSAAGKITSGAYKTEQEHDREEMALADRDVDRAKSTVEGASSDSKRAQEDVRETINYIRQYLAAKTQAAEAAIIKG